EAELPAPPRDLERPRLPRGRREGVSPEQLSRAGRHVTEADPGPLGDDAGGELAARCIDSEARGQEATKPRAPLGLVAWLALVDRQHEERSARSARVVLEPGRGRRPSRVASRFEGREPLARGRDVEAEE